MLKPNVCALGYGLFLAVNAAGVWGGVFPFLPIEFQTPQYLLAFFTAQSLVFVLSFLASAFGVYFYPKPTRRFEVALPATPYFLGWMCIIAALYAPAAARVLVAASGALLGLGSAGFYMLWQRIMAGLDQETGAHDLILGTAYSAVIYFSLHLIPGALTALLIPLVFLPLFCLCIVLTRRKVDRSQALYVDVPREHPKAYRRVLATSAVSALSIGALALCCGIVRSLAVESPSVGAVVNIVAMAASLVVALVLLALWQQRNLVLNVVTVFRVLFPFAMTMFLLIVVLGRDSLSFFGGAVYAFYSGTIMLMMLQCMQISRDDGINPVFIYGAFGTIVYAMHDVGFLGGRAVAGGAFMGLEPHVMASVTGMWLLAIIYFVSQGGFGQMKNEARLRMASIELISLNASPRSKGRSHIAALPSAMTPIPVLAVIENPDETSSVAMPRNSEPAASANRQEEVATERPADARAGAWIDGPEPDVRDRVSKQCLVLQQQYRLSSREREVAELLARGNSAAGVAERLVVSENTVKTHMQRIYGKLGIHKKQELLDLVESMDPALA